MLAAKYSGQCASCTHADYCTFPRTLGRPVRNCEEYCPSQIECYETKATPRTPRLVPDEAIAAARIHKGLCAICDHYDTCTFPRTEDVPVTCCEEYC